MDQKLYTVIGIVLTFVLCGLAAVIAAGWIVYSPDAYGLRVERFNVWMTVVGVSIALLMIGGSVRELGWWETVNGAVGGIGFLLLTVLLTFCAVMFTFGIGAQILLFGAPVVCLGMAIYLLAEKNYAWATALILMIIDFGVSAYIGSGFSSFDNLPYFRSYSTFWSEMFLLPLWGLAMVGTFEWRRHDRLRAALYAGIVGGGVWWIITTFYMPYLVMAMD